MLKIIDENNLIIKNKRFFFVVDIDSILYIEKEKNSKLIIIKTTIDVIKCTCSLRQIFEILRDKFFQAHKSIIINLKFVKNIEREKSIVCLKNGEIIYASSKYINDLLKKIEEE